MKYDPLKYHLQKIAAPVWTASFEEIEKVLGFSLPDSARQYPAWWANQQGGSRSHAWKTAGWFTSGLNLSRQEITFRRISDSNEAEIEAVVESSDTQEPAPIFTWDESESMFGTLRMEWVPIGQVYFDKAGRLSFPSKAPAEPGLYRFRIREEGLDESRYVGQSKNIRKRFNQNYRHGNVKQHTSHRINKELKEALRRNAEISVSIMTTDATIMSKSGVINADLSIKRFRLLFEAFAQCVEGDLPINTLNL